MMVQIRKNSTEVTGWTDTHWYQWGEKQACCLPGIVLKNRN